jgi:hypothetical protein
VTSTNDGNCGAYKYSQVTNSNGSNTYIANNCWGDPSCQQTVTARNPGNWSISANEPLGNTAVKTYPNVQQLMNDWTGSGWNGPGPTGDTPISAITRLSSSYTETMPHNRVTDAQAAYDIWLGQQGTGNGNEVMVWVDNVNRASGGASQLATATIGGQNWTLYGDRSGELIWSLDARGGTGTFAQQSSGTVDLLALLNWLITHGYKAAGTVIGQVDFGWEICSTGGAPENFGVSAYSITGSS